MSIILIVSYLPFTNNLSDYHSKIAELELKYGIPQILQKANKNKCILKLKEKYYFAKK